MSIIKALLSTFLFLTIHNGYSLEYSPEWEEWTNEQIEEDFEPYKEGITQEMLLQTMQWGDKWARTLYPHNPNTDALRDYEEKTYHIPGMTLCRYKVIDSVIYQSPHSCWSTFYGITAALVLEQLIKKYPVPDIDFIYYEFDSPYYKGAPLFEAPDGTAPFGPILLGSKSKKDKNLILYHDYATMCDVLSHKNAIGVHPNSYLYDWNMVSNELLSEQYPLWEDRMNMLIWRGRMTDLWDPDFEGVSPRIRLIVLCRNNGDLLDAYNLCGANLQDHLKYKYQIAMDGATSQYPGYIWRLLSNSLVFKQQSDVYLWFEKGIKPNVHYVEVDHYLTDLLDKILWARDNDSDAKQIAENAKQFVLESALPEHYLKFCHKVLLKYASLQKFTPCKPEKPVATNLYEFEIFSDPLTEEEKVVRRKELKKMGF